MCTHLHVYNIIILLVIQLGAHNHIKLIHVVCIVSCMIKQFFSVVTSLYRPSHLPRYCMFKLTVFSIIIFIFHFVILISDQFAFVFMYCRFSVVLCFCESLPICLCMYIHMNA